MNIKKISILMVIFLFLFTGQYLTAAENDNQIKMGIEDQVIAGYQGWFTAKGDGSGLGWRHWAGGLPRPHNLTFEMWPDVRDYPSEALFQTGFQKLGTGEPAELFSSHSQETLDLHFSWMKEYGIDGAALQRFAVSIKDEGELKDSRNSINDMARKAAEKHDRVFYIMYDISGMENDEIYETLKEDWEQEIIAELDITSSDNYLKQDDKPIVAIWGFGFKNRGLTREEAEKTITWFQDQGYYVIGGVPTYWRESKRDSEPDWQEIYHLFDMVSPWTVGRFRDKAGVKHHYEQVVKPDIEYAAEHDLDYLPVVFPGFSWYNWNDGSKNEIPRRGGQHLWEQVYYAADLEFDAMYVAMFDEYDEATAIAKTAENEEMTPENQYFLTLDADRYDLSSDFYLRLTGEAGKMLREEIDLTKEVPIPYRK